MRWSVMFALFNWLIPWFSFCCFVARTLNVRDNDILSHRSSIFSFPHLLLSRRNHKKQCNWSTKRRDFVWESWKLQLQVVFVCDYKNTLAHQFKWEENLALPPINVSGKKTWNFLPLWVLVRSWCCKTNVQCPYNTICALYCSDL